MSLNTYKERELNLYNRWREGDNAAKVELLGSLEPLIRRSVNKFYKSGIPEFAVRAEGFRLASGAIDSYDPKKAQLNTHVTNYLKKLSRFVTNYQNVGHIPEPRALIIGKYNTIYSNLEADKGREPTITELSDAMQIPPAEVERLQSELRADLSLTIEEDEDDVGFYSFTRDEETDPRVKQAIETVYFEADPLDKKILEYHFGLYGTTRLKSKDIALKLNLRDSDLKSRKTKLGIEINGLI
jgi:DNA-directed RNA polymerase sigma subunit (sigma70/sigma32)